MAETVQMTVTVTVSEKDLHDVNVYNQIAEAFKVQAHLDLNAIRAEDLANGVQQYGDGSA